ncbi:MAG: hypothetical protein WBY94_20695 [Polyangiaceae bacterium]
MAGVRAARITVTRSCRLPPAAAPPKRVTFQASIASIRPETWTSFASSGFAAIGSKRSHRAMTGATPAHFHEFREYSAALETIMRKFSDHNASPGSPHPP